MDLLSGVSWLCVLLFWGCIYLPPQKGHHIAHGYYLSENAQTSNQFDSEAFSNTEEEEEDKTQAMGHQNLVSHQKEPDQDNRNHGSVTGFDEMMTEQHRPESGQEQDELLVAPSAPSVQKYENMSSGNQNPFGVLLKEHAPETPVEDISFPTVNDFKRFIDTVKISFLTPGSDLSRFFQTARETMKNEFTSGAQNINGESSLPNSVKEGSVNDDDSENEVWSETVSEKSEPDSNYQTDSLSLLHPVDHTVSLNSHNDIQDSGPDSGLYYNPDATEYGLDNHGRLVDYGISRESIFASVPGEQHEDLESTSYDNNNNNVPEQKPAGGDYLSGHVTSYSVNPQDSLSKDPSHHSSWKSSINPLISEKIIQQPKYSSHTEDSGYHPSGDFLLGNQRVTVANLLYPQQPPSLTSYGKNIFDAPRTQVYIPLNASKYRESSDQLVQTYQPTVGKESKDTNYSPASSPASSGSAFSNSDWSPQNSSSHIIRAEASRSHDPQHQVSSRRQPIKSYLNFTVKPSSFPPDSERHDGNLRNQRVTVSYPSILSGQARDEKSDQSEQNHGSFIQEPEQMNDLMSIPTTRALDSTRSGISSQTSEIDAMFPINFPPTSEPKKAFSTEFENEVMSRNMNSKRLPSGVRNLQGLFSNLHQRGPPHTFIQLTKSQKIPTSVNRERGSRVHPLFQPILTSKRSGSTLHGVSGKNGNTKKLLPQTGPNVSPPFVNTYIIQSRNGYMRDKVSLSKSRYTP